MFATLRPAARSVVAAMIAAPLVTALTLAATAVPTAAQSSSGGVPGSGVPRTTALPNAAAVADGDAIACPIPAGSEFIDSWGARRSGGRRHQGVDMIAPRGTPIAAARSGVVEFKQSRLGGNAVWLTTSDGDRFYYAHLSAFEGTSRTVSAGDVIGYVGSSGNAQGPHLHFEFHPDGTAANPYDATYDACVQPTVDALHALDAMRRGAQFEPAPGDVDSALVAIRRSERPARYDIRFPPR